MAGLMDRGAATLVSRMQSAAGRPVLYTRKSDGAVIPVTAWVGNTLYSRTTKEPGASVIWGDRDYFIAVADLVDGGVNFTPDKGDQITESVNGVAAVFELQTPTGEPCWRYSDQTRQIVRCHTKRVS